VSLSEENLVRCDQGLDKGCQGGSMDNAFTWISENGICAEADYPYISSTAVTGRCRTPACKPVVTLTGHTDVPPRDENALKAAVSKQPVSVAIEADRSFQLYKQGILYSPEACNSSTQKLNHAYYKDLKK